MRLLESWHIRQSSGVRTIELLQGDLARLPPEQAVDILVVSAFADDYSPTPHSLIGALDREGISVAHLAEQKAIDMRQDFSCWISQPIETSRSFGRILCIESGWRGEPPEIADDLFRAIAPASIEFPRRTVAVPLIGAGDAGQPAERMLEAIVKAAASWLRRGLSVETIKIVVYSPNQIEQLTTVFRNLMLTERDSINEFAAAEAASRTNGYDLFVSYSREDSEHARRFVRAAKALKPDIRVFFDQNELKPGMSWLMNIAESLDAAKRVVAFYTPSYWASRICKNEFCAAYVRQMKIAETILFPIMVRTSRIPSMFMTLQYLDCREGDTAKLDAAGAVLCQSLGESLWRTAPN